MNEREQKYIVRDNTDVPRANTREERAAVVSADSDAIIQKRRLIRAPEPEEDDEEFGRFIYEDDSEEPNVAPYGRWFRRRRGSGIFEFDAYQYRVVPKPRSVWIHGSEPQTSGIFTTNKPRIPVAAEFDEYREVIPELDEEWNSDEGEY